MTPPAEARLLEEQKRVKHPTLNLTPPPPIGLDSSTGRNPALNPTPPPPILTPQAEARLLEEQKRVGDYLNASTEPKLRAIVEEELVKAHATTLIEARGMD